MKVFGRQRDQNEETAKEGEREGGRERERERETETSSVCMRGVRARNRRLEAGWRGERTRRSNKRKE